MTEQEAQQAVMRRHHWSSAHLLNKEVCRILREETQELLRQNEVTFKQERMSENVVSALLDGWFSDRWADVKAVTGTGQDSLGLGKNTEKGWKPKYGTKTPVKKPVRKPDDGNTKTWKLD